MNDELGAVLAKMNRVHIELINEGNAGQRLTLIQQLLLYDNQASALMQQLTGLYDAAAQAAHGNGESGSAR